MANSDQTNNITQEIEAILGEVAKVKNIPNYILKPDIEVQVGDGFMSQFFKGEVIDKDSGECFTVAIKKAPKFEFNYGPIFDNEVNFYSQAMPAFRHLQSEAGLSEAFNNVPEYFTSNLEKSKTYIALEHLKPKGYVLHDKTKYLTKEQFEMIFKVYGKFHALSFVLRNQNNEKYRKIVDGFKDVFNLFTNNDYSKNIMLKSINAAINSLESDSLAQKAAKNTFKDLVATVEKSFVYSGSYRCITHGDCWSNNMLFKYSKSGVLEDLKLIDFQLTRDGTPIHDLAYFFYSGASKSDMDSLEYYLKIYHNTLADVIRALGEDPEEIFPYEALKREWKENALMGVILGIYLWQVKLINKDDFVDVLKEGGTSKEDGENTGKLFKNLIDLVLSGENFKQKTSDILIHAFEIGILTERKEGN